MYIWTQCHGNESLTSLNKKWGDSTTCQSNVVEEKQVKCYVMSLHTMFSKVRLPYSRSVAWFNGKRSCNLCLSSINRCIWNHLFYLCQACLIYRLTLFEIEYRSDDVTFQRFGYHVSVEHDKKNFHSPNLVGIASWGPEIWPHENLISPTEISVNWSGSKQLWTRLIYTDFNGANEVFMRPYFGPPWTNSCQIWCVKVIMFYWNMVLKMLKWKKNDDVTLQYSIALVTKKSAMPR